MNSDYNIIIQIKEKIKGYLCNTQALSRTADHTTAEHIDFIAQCKQTAFFITHAHNHFIQS